MKDNEQPYNQYRIERVQRFGLNTLLNGSRAINDGPAHSEQAEWSIKITGKCRYALRERPRTRASGLACICATASHAWRGKRGVTHGRTKGSRQNVEARASSRHIEPKTREGGVFLALSFYLLSLCFSLLSLCVTIAGHRSAIASTRCLVARENESLPLLRTSRGFSLKSTLKIDRILCLIRFGILESMIQRFILTLELRMINVKFIKMTRCFCNYLRYISDEIMLILSLYTFIKKNALLYRTVFKITAE